MVSLMCLLGEEWGLLMVVRRCRLLIACALIGILALGAGAPAAQGIEPADVSQNGGSAPAGSESAPGEVAVDGREEGRDATTPAEAPSGSTGEASDASDESVSVEGGEPIAVDEPTATAPSGWRRVFGQDQLDTMQAISQTGWAASDTVVIATDATYWDALAANSLAGVFKCPVLLTSKNALSPQARREIQRLGAKKAYICGGPIAISSKVDREVKAAGCMDVERVYGADQQQTSIAIAKLVLGLKPSSSVVVATSDTFQDALSIAPYSYSNAVPVLICESGSDVLPAEALELISDSGISSGVIVGGPVAVSSENDSRLSAVGVSSIERVYGQTEYETSVSVARWELEHGMGLRAPGLATGLTFYDALTGAGLCGKNDSVLLVASSGNRVTITDFISEQRSSIAGGYVFGGPIAVSDSVYHTLEYCWQQGYSADYATDEEAPYKAVYNYEYYRNAYADIKSAFGNDRSATLNHFLSFGMFERRQASASFDVRSYYNQYEDLRRAFGVNNWPAYYSHYITIGQSEGRTGTGCSSLSGWQYHNVPWDKQPNNYYCGPASGTMILRSAGANWSTSGVPLNVWNLASYMRTDAYHYTSFHDRMFEAGMNAWLGRCAYVTIHAPSYWQARDAVMRSFDRGLAAAVDAQERRGGPHFNAHNNGTFSHIMVVDGYNNATDQVLIADPGAISLWAGAQPKFVYPSLSTFISTYCQQEIMGDGRQHIGMYAPL